MFFHFLYPLFAFYPSQSTFLIFQPLILLTVFIFRLSLILFAVRYFFAFLHSISISSVTPLTLLPSSLISSQPHPLFSSLSLHFALFLSVTSLDIISSEQSPSQFYFLLYALLAKFQEVQQ